MCAFQSYLLSSMKLCFVLYKMIQCLIWRKICSIKIHFGPGLCPSLTCVLDTTDLQFLLQLWVLLIVRVRCAVTSRGRNIRRLLLLHWREDWSAAVTPLAIERLLALVLVLVTDSRLAISCSSSLVGLSIEMTLSTPASANAPSSHLTLIDRGRLRSFLL